MVHLGLVDHLVQVEQQVLVVALVLQVLVGQQEPLVLLELLELLQLVVVVELLD